MLRNALAEALQCANLSQVELSRRSGVSDVVISYVMTGSRASFSKAAAPKIHAALGGAIPLTVLLGLSDPRSEVTSGERPAKKKPRKPKEAKP